MIQQHKQQHIGSGTNLVQTFDNGLSDYHKDSRVEFVVQYNATPEHKYSIMYNQTTSKSVILIQSLKKTFQNSSRKALRNNRTNLP